MIYLFGNCQMEFLGQALAGLGIAHEHRPLATPLGPLLSGGHVPPELLAWSRRFDLAGFLHGRTLRNQFQAMTPEDRSPSLFVVNLFHENEPLFAHASGYLFFVDPAAWEVNAPFAAWMKDQFQQVKLPEMDYLNRWAQFVAALRQTHPQTPILLASQLSHYPAFGPHPYSYLTCWEKVWPQAASFLAELAAELGNCHVLDADHVFADVWNRSRDSESSGNMDEHCPFLKITIDDSHGLGGVGMRRDLEHIGSLWPAMAARVADFLATGTLRREQSLPDQWQHPYQPRPLPVTRLRELLASGSNYAGARAVNAFFHDLSHDYTDLLGDAGGAMPVCHGTLHMVHRYALLHPGPGLVRWCRGQQRKVAAFTANGEQYQRQYRHRLDDIMARVNG